MHVLPAVDDGARTLEEACEMLRLAAGQGVEAVFATPHDAAFLNADVPAALRLLKEAAAQRGIPVELYLGCELRFSAQTAAERLRGLAEGLYPTMGASRCVLTEFTFGTSLREALYCINTLAEHGYKPIVAHVERYPETDLAYARALREAGALLQINAGSIAEEPDEQIRRRVKLLLSERLADMIGTDAHRTDRRPPLFGGGMEALRRLYTEEYALLLAAENPEKYLFAPAARE